MKFNFERVLGKKLLSALRKTEKETPPSLLVADDSYSRLADETREIFLRLKSGQSHPGDFVTLTDVSFDVNDAWVVDMMASDTLHDEDYVVFSHFRDPATRVLDVGANRGYSVASMRAAGCLAQIMSFEVSEAFRSSLEQVKAIDGDRYSFEVTGVSDREGWIEFFIPVVNGVTLSALTTGNLEDLHVDSIVKNVVDFARSYIHTPPYEVRVCRMPAAIDRLDRLVPEGPEIVAAKFDVEGLEHAALSGATGILVRDKPLLLIEGGNFDIRVQELLGGLGYTLAQRDGSTLFRPAAPPARSNAFFVATERLPHYIAVGLWTSAPGSRTGPA